MGFRSRTRLRNAINRGVGTPVKGERTPDQISDRRQTPPNATGRNQAVRKREQFSGRRRFF